jgi:uncharacterized protein
MSDTRQQTVAHDSEPKDRSTSGIVLQESTVSNVELEPLRAQLRPLVLYFALTFAFAWVLWLGGAALTSRADPSGVGRILAFLPGTFAPAYVALWMTYRSRSSGEHRELLARLFHWQVPIRWYVFAASYMVIVKLLAALLFRISEGMWPSFGSVPLYLLLLATAFSTPVQAGEEIGWRGYALPRLANALGFTAASVVLGIIWALWHLPLFLIANTDSTAQPIVTFVLAVIPISVAMTWVYLNTGGSLVPLMLMHAAINNTGEIVPSSNPNPPGVLSLVAPKLAWLTIIVLWLAAAFFLIRMSRVQRHSSHKEDSCRIR